MARGGFVDNLTNCNRFNNIFRLNLSFENVRLQVSLPHAEHEIDQHLFFFFFQISNFDKKNFVEKMSN